MTWLTLHFRQPDQIFSEAERCWLDGAFTKVCARVDSVEELLT